MPTLKISVTKAEFDALNEQTRGFYKQSATGYVLDTDVDVEGTNQKLEEFRDNNRDLFKENKTLKEKLEPLKDVDPAKYSAMATEIDALKKKGITGAGDIDQQIQQAVAAAIAPLQKKVETSEAERERARAQLAEKTLDDTLWAVGAKLGISEAARVDYLPRAKKVFRLDEDGTSVTAVKADGSPLYSKKKVTEVLTPEEWTLEHLPLEAPHLFKESKGSGDQSRRRPEGNARVVSQENFGQNLEAIAKGDVTVLQPR